MPILDEVRQAEKELLQAITKEWTKSRTVFTALFFGSLVYCILHRFPIPEILNTIVSTLLGYWFGQGKQTQKEEVK
jgi:hypothetical protein